MYDEYPYFLKNKEWYYWSENLCHYVLTDKAPKKARESYEEFYSSSDCIINDYDTFRELVSKGNWI